MSRRKYEGITKEYGAQGRGRFASGKLRKIEMPRSTPELWRNIRIGLEASGITVIPCHAGVNTGLIVCFLPVPANEVEHRREECEHLSLSEEHRKQFDLR